MESYGYCFDTESGMPAVCFNKNPTENQSLPKNELAGLVSLSN
jgi:hypothetical protein